MKRMLFGLVAGLAIVVLLDQPAWAQRGRRPNRFRDRPATSPYLNLFRGDTDPAINYHRLVRPELEFRAFDERQSRSMLNLENRFDTEVFGAFEEAPSEVDLGGSGHPTYFMNHLGYFPFNDRGASGRRSGSRQANRNSRSRSRGIRGIPRVPGVHNIGR